MSARFALCAFLLGMTQIASLPLYVTPASAESSQGDQDELEMYWREHASKLRAERDAAEQHYREAKDAFLFAQNRRQLIKGERRQKIIDEYNAAKDALARAEKALEDLPEEARRAGAAPGWIRE